MTTTDQTAVEQTHQHYDTKHVPRVVVVDGYEITLTIAQRQDLLAQHTLYAPTCKARR